MRGQLTPLQPSFHSLKQQQASIAHTCLQEGCQRIGMLCHSLGIGIKRAQPAVRLNGEIVPTVEDRTLLDPGTGILGVRYEFLMQALR